MIFSSNIFDSFNKCSSFLLTIHFFDSFYVALIFSFLIDVQILNKFLKNAFIGVGLFVSRMASIPGAFLTSHINKNYSDKTKIMIHIGNFLSFLLSFVIIICLYLDIPVLFFISYFAYSFLITIVNDSLKYLLLKGLTRDERGNVLVLEGCVNNSAFIFGHIISFIYYFIHHDNWKMESMGSIFVISQIALTIKFVLVIIYCANFYDNSNNGQGTSENKSGGGGEGAIGKNCAGATENSLNPKIPWLITISRTLFAIGSGLSIKYLVVYMIQEFKLKPSQTSIASSISPLLEFFLIMLFKFIGNKIGNALAVIIGKFIGFIALLSFVFSRHLWLSLLIFVIRYPLQNCVAPIISSILFDHAKNEHYVYWIASIHIVRFIRALSALIGGIVADKYGYKVCFYTCCVLYVCAQLVFLPCQFIDKKRL